MHSNVFVLLILVLVQILLFVVGGGFAMVEEEVQTVVVVVAGMGGGEEEGFKFEFGFAYFVGGICECVGSSVIVIFRCSEVKEDKERWFDPCI